MRPTAKNGPTYDSSDYASELVVQSALGSYKDPQNHTSNYRVSTHSRTNTILPPAVPTEQLVRSNGRPINRPTSQHPGHGAERPGTRPGGGGGVSRLERAKGAGPWCSPARLEEGMKSGERRERLERALTKHRRRAFDYEED